MGYNTKIYLVDVKPVLNPDTGKNALTITHETPVYADKQEVGQKEYYSAAGVQIQLQAVYEIPAHLYHGERYMLTADRQTWYQISRTAKGHTDAFLRLPVKAVSNKEYVPAVNDAQE